MSTPSPHKPTSGRRPEKMLAWLSSHWSALDAAIGGLMLLRPRRELLIAWSTMVLAVASAAALGLLGLRGLETVPAQLRTAAWFELAVVPVAATLLVVPPVALAGLWLSGRALARERKAAVSPVRGQFAAAFARLLLLRLPRTALVAVVAYGVIALSAQASVGHGMPGIVQSLGWAAALALVAGWAGPRLMYAPARAADRALAEPLRAAQARLRELARAAYGRNALLVLLFSLLLGMVYIVAQMLLAADPVWFAAPAGQATLVAVIGVCAGFVIAHAATTAAWAYARLTLGETASDDRVAAIADATAALAGVARAGHAEPPADS